MTDKPATRFKPRDARNGAVVLDTWNNDKLLASCSSLNAAAMIATFLNGEEEMARTLRKSFLAELNN